MTATRLVLWRHGRTAHNAQARLQGQVDVPLDEVGRWQARMAAATLLAHHEPARIVTSDLGRALETAQFLARACGLEPVVDPRLRERSFGRWEGLTGEEIAATWPDEYAAWRAWLDPQGIGAESRDQVAQRCLVAVTAHAQEMVEGTLVVVSHGAAIGALVGALLGQRGTWRGIGGMHNCHWAHLAPSHGPVEPAWRLLGYNLGPTDASSDWNAGPDAPDDDSTRDPD